MSEPSSPRSRWDACTMALKRLEGPLHWLSDPRLNGGDLKRITAEAQALLSAVRAELAALAKPSQHAYVQIVPYYACAICGEMKESPLHVDDNDG